MFFEDANRGADIYIDLGTANTLVVAAGKGIVVDEPSVIAYVSSPHSTAKKVVAVGSQAKQKIGRTPGHLVASHPLKDGVIADLDITEAMLRYFMDSAKRPFRFLRPRTVISLPYGVTDVEKAAVKRAGITAGAKEVILVDEPMAAAVGAGLPVDKAEGSMVIDIGGGTTEVAVISLCGIVHCEAVRVGGHRFDQAIVDYIQRRHNLVVGNQSAEKLKIQIGTAIPGENKGTAEIRGVDYVTGLPRAIRVSSAEVQQAIEGLLSEIIGAARRALEKTPPDLLGDIVQNGLVVVGGGALFHGLRERLESELKIPVRIDRDPLRTVAKGGAMIIENKALLGRVELA